jgi:hypothetical protein
MPNAALDLHEPRPLYVDDASVTSPTDPPRTSTAMGNLKDVD